MAEATTENQNNQSARALPGSNGYSIPKRRGSQYVDLLLQRMQKLEGLDSSPVIGVTSPAVRQGVSTLASNLAIRAADHFHEPVLLVDCNFKNQRTSRMYRCTGEGFGECYFGNRAIEQCAKSTNIANLNVLGIGKSKLARQIVVDSDVVSNFFKNLRNSFRYSVLDLPVAGEPSAVDGMLQFMDGVFIVASYGMRKRNLEDLKNKIVQHGGRVLGIVMTGDESKVPGWLPRFLR